MKERVKKVQDHYKLTQKQFAVELGVAEATISSIYRGRTAPTNNLIQAVHNAYPAVNINWLMFGEGEMLLPLTAETAVGGSVTNEEAMGALMNGQEMSGQNVGFSMSDSPTLFDAPQAGNTPQKAQKTGSFSGLPVELQLAEALSELKKAKDFDKPKRKIKEIRVFFDDGTFETFTPSGR